MTPPNPQPEKPAVRRFEPYHRCDQGHKIHGEMERDDADGEYVLFSDWEAERKIKEAEKLILLEEVAKNVQLRAQLTALEAENQELVKEANHDIKALEAERDALKADLLAAMDNADTYWKQRLRAALSNAGEGKEKGK